MARRLLAFVAFERFPNLGIGAINQFDNIDPPVFKKLNLESAINGRLGHNSGVVGGQFENPS